ncbi:malonamoyl-CoA synthetase vrtB [Colletotrichum spaethianum]|uniref:Malonamoyl-CoA synthetase vrtB n=1 Tax=Colletotrichum spaethianum TaxID=700344 RepID=A0AA37PFZ7_9PEZI|nr:malonamoyl-CoA synthetase vrtB [Colletotrichum spaethianum]GKT51606.1 malonamoyl-CoA synthetase vrtB [Colletotrichum spaethianum]
MTVTSVTRNELWRHPDPTSTPMWAFLLRVNSKYGLELADYPGLYKWSIENVAEFWEEVWHFVGITASRPFDKVRWPMPFVTSQTQPKPHPVWLHSAWRALTACLMAEGKEEKDFV